MYQFRQTLARVYAFVFILYLLIPLGIMGAAAFNDNKTPSIVPWKGVTGKWFDALFADETMWLAFRNTLVVAVAVSLLAILVGTAAAILINSISGRLRTTLYGLMISTLLIPGAVIGITVNARHWKTADFAAKFAALSSQITRFELQDVAIYGADAEGVHKDDMAKIALFHKL